MEFLILKEKKVKKLEDLIDFEEIETSDIVLYAVSSDIIKVFDFKGNISEPNVLEDIEFESENDKFQFVENFAKSFLTSKYVFLVFDKEEEDGEPYLKIRQFLMKTDYLPFF